MRPHRYLYAIASEGELNELASGKVAGAPRPWPFPGTGLRLAPGQVGVLWKEHEAGASLVRPLALVAEPSEHRRLFARFSQVRSDLSPLSAWCHIFTPTVFSALDEPSREADLGGLEAAWAGLIIAEAAILSDRPVSQLKLAACLATQAYAVARSLAIWSGIPTTDVLLQYEGLQRDVRSSGGLDLGRSNFAPLWSTLATVSLGYGAASGPYERVANAIMALKKARELGLDEPSVLEASFPGLTEGSFLGTLEGVGPEDRLRQFDHLAAKASEERIMSARRAELSFLAGYLATVAAGGSASLSLANNVAKTVPEISGWAHLIGGLGERVTWSGGFYGLGRLVARELMRPFRLDEPPQTDFAADEARVLVDRQVSDPLVHLQLKQSRVATVALYPGVNIQIPLAEPAVDQRRQPERAVPQPSATQRASAAEESLNAIVNALVPILLDRLRDQLPQVQREKTAKGKWTKGGQRKLPLGEK